MGFVNFGPDSLIACKSLPAKRANSCLENEGVKQMFDMDDSLRSRRIVTLVFAILSGISAVSTALVPALAHI
jgi:hypothetical protein